MLLITLYYTVISLRNQMHVDASTQPGETFCLLKPTSFDTLGKIQKRKSFDLKVKAKSVTLFVVINFHFRTRDKN